MKPTSQQKQTFREALDQRMTAAGLANQRVADLLTERGHPCVAETVRKWRVADEDGDSNTPQRWPAVVALDEIVGAGGELVAILGAPDAGLSTRMDRLEELVAELAKRSDEQQARIEALLRGRQ